jgi:hypothetical protein
VLPIHYTVYAVIVCIKVLLFCNSCSSLNITNFNRLIYFEKL